MDINSTIEAVKDGANWVGTALTGIDELGTVLNVLLIVLGALDIIGTFLFPQSTILKLPKIIRFVNMTLKVMKYLEEGFKKLEKSKGGFTFEQEDTNKQK